MAAGRGQALRCRGAGLGPRPEGGEEGGVRSRKGGRGGTGGLEAEGGRDGEGPWGRRPQGETLELERRSEKQRKMFSQISNTSFLLSDFSALK